ncbi:molybdopterin oxidoreductase family protein [Mesorhizobium sp.]|uniref:molybdopterin oxidoreductase family protein n=1 Tax=Mesorhizobium sp. TaxID=1871066 RepID=UPI000FE41828|nr:molybdopterin oxidoreductase family protein [Mesorhizobium sp.]RWH71830.1 MAG: formate dehydrogenase [Mesorhizobium sp.]RWL32837.1 MAG: formate dehydrogenase [Mesorhizobium sp.]RWL33845.1 MAG: formate dehydrogenase [Mesorhizobium sp.]RWL39938.1 MAG: formate dehydrogenase [Mesorhizobium sp.]RWL45962.1 MAG: formate dehydrogenase [Mesorhizobium sp.]
MSKAAPRGANSAPSQRPLADTHAPNEGDGVETSPSVSDRIAKTTCYMCACRCGIDVHLKDGKIRYINGNKDHPVNRGVICGKGSAGIMQHYSPARLRKPLLRTGPRGSGEFREIEWDEALAIATERLSAIRRTDPKKLAFFTGRDQSQSLTGWWAAKFGTPNFAAHGGFCSVNMAAGGLYTIGGSFWEFGEPDWDNTKYFMLFGVAEDHDSNPIKIGLGKLKTRGAKVVSINPCRTGYNAIADDWIGIRPGTDGLFVLALVHELLKAGRVDLDYLLRYTNAPVLVVQEPGAVDDGLFVRDSDGNPLAWDRVAKRPVNAADPEAKPALTGSHEVGGRRCVPVFQLIAERYLDETYSPDAVAERCGVSAEAIRRIAAELAHVAFEQAIELPIAWTDWAGRRHETIKGRPVSMHAMRGISAHSNGFHTCRAIHLLQVLLGAIDVPGGFRFKPPYPRCAPPGPKPCGKDAQPMMPLDGMPLGFVCGPDDLLVDEAGRPTRIDKAYSWEAPLAAHGLMHTVIRNAWAGDPYPIDTLMMYMSNMAWNSSMNTVETIAMLTEKDEASAYKIPFIIYSDAYYSETVPFADLVLPDTTYLERHDCISLLDRPISHADGAADAIRHPVVEPDRDVRPFQSVLIELGARLGLPSFVEEDGSAKYRDYADYIVSHERTPGIGPLAGWRGKNGGSVGRGDVNPDQLQRYIDNGGFWHHEFADDQRYYKMGNRAYLEFAVEMGFIAKAEPIVFQLYSEPIQRFRLAARGHGKVQPPDTERGRIEAYMDPLPFWYAPFEDDAVDLEKYPLHALTQRPMHMYHSWGSQNAWLRQITSQNRLFVHHQTASKLGLADDDWVWIESVNGRVKGQIKLIDGVNPDTVWTWNAIGKRRGSWGLKDDAAESNRGFLLNHIIGDQTSADADGKRYSNSDPITGQAAWFDVRVRIAKCAADEAGFTEPQFERFAQPPHFEPAPEVLRFGAEFRTKGEAAE